MPKRKKHPKNPGGLKEPAMPKPQNGSKPTPKRPGDSAREPAGEQDDAVQTKKPRMNDEVHAWLRMAHEVEDHAFEKRDTELLRFVHKFVSGVLQISELFHVFQNSPGGRIDGERGVAKQLDISRNAVYLRLEFVGLTAEDFREPRIDLAQLVERSETVGPLLMELKEKALDRETRDRVN